MSTDTLEEAEKVFKGRVTTVSKRFREPGNTDEEIKKMQAKKKKAEKKDLKEKQGQAHTLNIEYLVDEIKLQTMTSSDSVSNASNILFSTANDTNAKNLVNEKEPEGTTTITEIKITDTLSPKPIPEKV